MPLLLLFVLLLIAGSVLGWVAFFKIKSLRQQVDQLNKIVKNTRNRIDVLRQEVGLAPDYERGALSQESVDTNESEGISETAAANISDTGSTRDVWTGEFDDGDSSSRSKGFPTDALRDRSPAWFKSLKEQWMIWLGGLSVSLAGIFLVRYSIEQGLLGPTARVALGIATGLFLHAAAEWLRRHNVGHYNAFAALAGGASITLYAALLAALLLYELLTPLPVFLLLALVSLLTMSLALVHGPVLAILGILGAYAVPILVDTGSESILGLYVYSLIITAAAIYLMRRVYRSWLWGGMLFGSLSFWYLSMFTDAADGYRGYYLAALVYLYVALPYGDWLLSKPDPIPEERMLDQKTLLLTIAITVLTFGLAVYIEPSIQSAIFYWTPVIVVFGLAGGKRNSLKWIPIAALVTQLFAWFARGLETEMGIQLAGLSDADQASFLIYAGWMVGLYSLISTYNYLQNRISLWIAMLVMTPLAWLALSYLLVSELSESVFWGSMAASLGVVYLGIAWWKLSHSASPQRDRDSELHDINTMWLITAGHFAYSLAVAIMVREATLTLALSVQLISLAWLIRKFEVPELDILIKALLGVVVTRLTLNPWLLTYPDDVHWSFWTYGGSTLLAAVACRLVTDNSELRKWLEAATLHLLVLFLWAETRYWLYEGNIFSTQIELMEFAINTAVWSTLALVYYRRHQVSETFKTWYLFSSRILLGLSVASYGLVLFPLNPLWGSQAVSSTPIVNELLLAFGYPFVVCLLLYRYYEPEFRRYFAYGACLTGFVFINMEIRHLWQGTVNINLSTGNGELYTYTIIWLLLAIGALLAGSIRFGNVVYKGGMALLILVVAKIFLVDMDDLEGLLRVASFMGLGLSLLGLAYLYQRFNLTPEKTDGTSVDRKETT